MTSTSTIILVLLLLLVVLSTIITAQGNRRMPRFNHGDTQRRQSSGGTSESRQMTRRGDRYCFYTALKMKKGNDPSLIDAAQIKSAYRQLAKQFHPDKLRLKTDKEKENAKVIFSKIQEAYEILVDPEKKKVYDEYGMRGFEAWEDGKDPSKYMDEKMRQKKRNEAMKKARDDAKKAAKEEEKRLEEERKKWEQEKKTDKEERKLAKKLKRRCNDGNEQACEEVEELANQRIKRKKDLGEFDKKKKDEGPRFGEKGFNFDEYIAQQGNRMKQETDPFGTRFGGHGNGPVYDDDDVDDEDYGDEDDLFDSQITKVRVFEANTFPKKSNPDMWFFYFYANNEEVSRTIGGAVEDLAHKSHLAYQVGALECTMYKEDEDVCLDLLEENGMDGEEFPQIAMLVNGKYIFLDDDEFSEDLTAADYHKFAIRAMPDKLITQIKEDTHINGKLLKTRTSTADQPALLLLTDKTKTSTMYYSIVHNFRKQFVFGESRGGNTSVRRAVGTRTFPSLVAFTPAGKIRSAGGAEAYNDYYDLLVYTGSLTKEAIAEWLDKILLDLEEDELGLSEEL